MVNKVFLLGRLGKDPEVRYLDNNRAVANFTIATNEVFIDKSGNKVEQTDWHNIEMWDALARNAEKVLKKGRTVFIEGKIKNETWTDKDGNKRSAVRIRALQFQVVASPNSENTSSSDVKFTPPVDDAPIDLSADDLPF